MYGPLSPCNSFLNSILSLDDKGVSNIYNLMIGRHKDISDKAVKNLTDKIEIEICCFSMSR